MLTAPHNASCHTCMSYDQLPAIRQIAMLPTTTHASELSAWRDQPQLTYIVMSRARVVNIYTANKRETISRQMAVVWLCVRPTSTPGSTPLTAPNPNLQTV
eukprot:366203-Chlamydomonas_euryale.AAC.9